MSDTLTALVVREARDALASLPPDADLDARLRAAMRAASGHWLVTNENEQLRGAVAAVVEHYGLGSPEADRLVREFRFLGRFGAMLDAAQRGVVTDLESVLGGEGEAVTDPVGLLRIWREVTGRPS